ncbi:MAG: hypothetical protein A3H70_00115 [Candidatus Komeilibacteria bacterium RIFCSPLOWO2_02_FULL_48_11]|uniref:Uncharacterized protein n=1 Tax=Candidatus Komeilibacteria bacterium RIFCSPLOWO2_02_FULL_48_11 TaxID=1798553 RepID=A0A1G2BRF9_9BACT|nr:MAG: hypothetical protein A3H70_00115 [Candidatus Komeilibacteria bacterium RIFCSPLOWO2_02_FULL_48_11]
MRHILTFGQPVLRLISGGETLTIEATDGYKTIQQATDVFTYINMDCNHDFDEVNDPTPKIQVDIYNLEKDGVGFRDILGEDADFDKVYFTQGQVVSFVQKYKKRTWMGRYRYSLNFPFKSKGIRFLQEVYVFGEMVNTAHHLFDNRQKMVHLHPILFVLPQM